MKDCTQIIRAVAKKKHNCILWTHGDLGEYELRIKESDMCDRWFERLARNPLSWFERLEHTLERIGLNTPLKELS